MTARRFIALVLALSLGATGCSVFGAESGTRTITAEFSRAVQMFPGNSVRVLGVDVGRVTDVSAGRDSVEVTFRIDDPEIKLPADVQATIVPVSLLGERYIELFPAYEGGPTFEGDHIDMADTNVPTEQDELLRGLQDYFGALDPDKVEAFVVNAASVLRNNGQNLNDLINYGTSVISTLSRKRDSLARLFQELNTITQALATRQEKLGRLIRTYNQVARIVNENRAAVEGTIDGLSLAAAELASLLSEHRDPLGADIRTLTRTGRTLDRNIGRFAQLQKWADRLFMAANRAVDYKEDWLRLSNQGGQLFQLILDRIRDRLLGLCNRPKLECDPKKLVEDLPDVFCRIAPIPECRDRLPRPPTQRSRSNVSPGEALEGGLRALAENVGEGGEKRLRERLGIKGRNCKKAEHPKRCRERKRDALEKAGDDVDDIIRKLEEEADGATGGLNDTGGLP